MSNTAEALTEHQQRGTICYTDRDYTIRTVQGWFSRQGDTVIMRKIGGRNRYAFITVNQILDFQLYGEAK